MLEIKLLREEFARVEAMLLARHSTLKLDEFMALDRERRDLITESDLLKNERKKSSQQIGQLMKSGGDPSALKAEVGVIGDKIKKFDDRLAAVELELNSILALIPNMLDESTPAGASELDNLLIYEWGERTAFDFPVKDHHDLGTALGILDFEAGTKITGARFTLLRGAGARLERALINFMLDVHAEQGYFEVLPPFMVNAESMFGTGQLPKFGEDLFQVKGNDYYLIPTAEVPVTNIHRDEILDESKLPVRYQAYTPCFRAEAGSYGRDTRGVIRQHQFNKVELVQFVHPEQSSAALDQLRLDAEEILRRLQLPYRVMQLCSADISFSAAKCYDLEVWLPGQQAYREISSCSNFKDFQARRAKIRYKEKATGKNHFVHTLNGSGLAVGRTLVAILENYQQADGRIAVPEALKPYFKEDFIETQPR